MNQYTSCNGTENKFWLSHICTNGSDITNYECYNKYYFESPTPYVIRKGLGVWLILVGIIGGLGNLYTLISIPFAASRNKFGLNRNFRNNTLFILHLCFIDLCCCLTYIFPQGIIHVSGKWPFPPVLECTFIVFMGNTTVLADMLAMASVALTRALSTIIPHKWKRICERKLVLPILFVSVWMLSGITNIPYFIKAYGTEVGWDCTYGQCGFRSTCLAYNNESVPRFIDNPEEKCNSSFYGNTKVLYLYTWILYGISLVIIVLSYVVIFCKIHYSKKSIDNTKTIRRKANRKKSVTDLSTREKKMTITILILILLNLTCWIPYQLFNVIIFEVVGEDFEKFYYDFVIGLYFTQFSLNFFVYVLRSEQYRNSFVYCWTKKKQEMFDSLSRAWDRS